MIEIDGLFQYLNQDAVVSSFVAGRIHQDILPKGYSLPAIVYFQVTGDAIESLDGDDSTEIKSFQFSCFAKDSKTARQIRRAVRMRLLPKADSSPSFDLPDGTHIQSARFRHEGDQPPEEGISETVRHSMIEIEFTYENPS